MPEGLDLDERINPVEEEEEEESDATVGESDEEREQERKKKNKRRDKAGWGDGDDEFVSSEKFSIKLSKKEIKKMKKDAEKEKKRRTTDPFYLGAKKGSEAAELLLVDAEEVDAIPIFKLSDDEGKKKKKKKKKAASSEVEETSCQKRPTIVSKETYYSVKRDLL